ncbi:MazG-like family protein [Clostridium beijerinckii]|nr:MazG-like family protein [Clostridium beijerinckii]OOM31477.1 MazG-like family protein [Clostridium beijerinckii]OOM38249.1 MazG-like family protein [Clostridium beijerinckii]
MKFILCNICYNKHKIWKSIERVNNMKETINRIRKFRNDRDWSQFHTPANLSKAISIEAGELLEEFLWDEENYNKEHVLEELADVMVYCIHMADSLGVDLEEIMNSKMDKNEEKYPVEKAKGNSKKYTEL